MVNFSLRYSNGLWARVSASSSMPPTTLPEKCARNSSWSSCGSPRRSAITNPENGRANSSRNSHVPRDRNLVELLIGKPPHEVFIFLESLGRQQSIEQSPCPRVLRGILGDDVLAHRDLRTMLLDQRTDVVALRLERQPRKRARDRDARGKRRVLVHRESFLVSRYGHDALLGL